MKALVTGGAGFIGSHLVDDLLKKGFEVTVMDNLSTGNRKNLPSGVEILVSDVGVSASWEVLPAFDYVFHLAAMVSVEESMKFPLQCQRDNVDAILYLLEYARRVKVKKVIFASSAAVYGDGANVQSEMQIPSPKSPYGLSKLCGEHLLSLYSRPWGIPFVAFRMFNVYGPRQALGSSYASVIPIFISRTLQDKNLQIHGDGQQTRDFIYVKQVTDCYCQAATGDMTGVYNLGNGGSLPIQELAKKVLSLGSSKSCIECVEPRVGDIRVSQADISELKKRFTLMQGDFSDFLLETWNYYRNIR